MPWRFTSVTRASQFVGLRELHLDLSVSPVGLTPLSTLVNLEKLVLWSVSVLVLPGSDIFPNLKSLEIPDSALDFNFSIHPGVFLPKFRILRVAFSRWSASYHSQILDLRHALQSMPNLELLLFPLPSYSSALSSLLTLLEVKPDLRILDCSGRTLWSHVIGEAEGFIAMMKEFQTQYPSNPTLDINATGMHDFANPPFDPDRIKEMAALGWDVKSRYRTVMDSEIAYLVSHPARSLGALLRLLLPPLAASDTFQFMCSAWADITVQELINTEPVHPVILAFAIRHQGMIRWLCDDRASQWDWFAPVDAPSVAWMHGTPILVCCLVATLFQPLQTSPTGRHDRRRANRSCPADPESVLAMLSAEVRERLETLLQAPHPSLRSWMHYFAAHIPYGRLVTLSDTLPAACLVSQLHIEDQVGLKPAHYALENFQDTPDLLQITPDDYLAAVAAPDGASIFGLRKMRVILKPEKFARESPRAALALGVVDSLVARGVVVDWLKLNLMLLGHAACHLIFPKLPAAERQEVFAPLRALRSG